MQDAIAGQQDTSLITHNLVINKYLIESDIPLDGLVARSARDYLADDRKNSPAEAEDILVGIALVRAIASWRKLLHIGEDELDTHLYQAQMNAEIHRISKFLLQQYSTKAFFSRRHKRKIKEYIEILKSRTNLI
jgi:hypothetical protein